MDASQASQGASQAPIALVLAMHAAHVPAAPAPLPPGWQAAYDATYQAYYYVHPATGHTQWDPPQHHAETAQATPTGAPASGDSSTTTNSSSSMSSIPAGPFWYYDPSSRLLGPFSAAQLASWRAMLPMDLLLLTQEHAAVAAAAGAGGDAARAAAAGEKAEGASLCLADLLGDAALLAHFKQSQQAQDEHEAPAATASPDSKDQRQHQQQSEWPPKASAPPAPVWQSWVDRHRQQQHLHYTHQLYAQQHAYSCWYASAAWAWAGPAAAAAADPLAAGAIGPRLPTSEDAAAAAEAAAAAAAAAAGFGAAEPARTSDSAGGTKRSASFERYAAAALQGLPPHDDAVRLAAAAAAAGCSLSDALAPQQQYRLAGWTQQHGAGADCAASALADAGLAVTADGVQALMVKDPRSGRLSVAPGGAGGGGGSAAASGSLYGDMARWVDPAAIEAALHSGGEARRRLKQQGGLPPAGGGGNAKRARATQ